MKPKKKKPTAEIRVKKVRKVSVKRRSDRITKQKSKPAKKGAKK
jgi:hypothetical protein